MKFGTDGVRGPAADFTDPFTAGLGAAAARVLAAEPDQPFVIGMDTRESGPRIAAALVAGIDWAGARPDLLGVIPTPAVAYWCAQLGVPGAVISASHNPFDDNGIKFFAPGGHKLSDSVEERLEAELASIDATGLAPSPLPDADRDAIDRYAASIIGTTQGRRLDGLEVVIDCANGAAFEIAPQVLERLGAHLTVMHAEPDGCNINADCGSTHPGSLQRRVVDLGADVGLAFDGDADRVLAVDEAGSLVDGDQIIAMCALDLAERGELAGNTVVVTIMTNLGFRMAMDDHGVDVVETAVGDRYVLEALRAGGYSLGGEQSGHVVFSNVATTGDGLLTGVAVLDLLVRSTRPLSELAAVMVRLPQVLVNVEVPERDPDIAEHIAADIAAAQESLAGTGRVLIRPSGTEPLVRVMVEAGTAQQAQEVADRLAGAVESWSAGS